MSFQIEEGNIEIAIEITTTNDVVCSCTTSHPLILEQATILGDNEINACSEVLRQPLTYRNYAVLGCLNRSNHDNKSFF